MEVLKVLAICFITAFICLILKGQRNEFAFLISAFASVLILLFLIKNVIVPLTVLQQKIEMYGINISYFKTALKALGIGYITNFTADSCRDAGQAALASKAELAGKIALFILSVPLVISVMETALGFIK
ncbi:MAG: SpoIIIAC/SpoIIIAD family protein [Acutalibacteraceae bacterium]|nr:SpoIIIAC/SpoIIIAD family protein [Acutalibacteraceae bacterium]